MIKLSTRDPMQSRKRAIYAVAALTAMVVFLPFQSHPWAIYVGACAGYTVLVSGLRWVNQASKAPARISKPAVGLITTHLGFLAVVIGWVWLALFLRPNLPYILRTEDTSHPYFGLAFLGALGLLLLEAIKQRWLFENPDSGHLGSESISAQQSPPKRK